MPLSDLKVTPGINREGTPTAVSGTWFAGNNVRFRSGQPEKIGGWQQDSAVPDPEGAEPPFGVFWGVARHLYNWLTLKGYNMLGIGTSMKYYIQNGVGGIVHDVTPIALTTLAGDVTFAATNGSVVLTVTDAGHGATVGDFVTYSGAVSLGGVITAAILNAEFQIATVIDVNTYTVVLPIAANALDVGNGGAAVVGAYQLPVGLETFISGLGWGAGGWGGITGSVLSGWGEASPVASVGLQPRLWSASNFGERLIANPRGFGLYLWTPNANPNIVDRMVLLSGGDTPVKANSVLVSDASRFVLTFGVNDYGQPDIDPMLVRWSDQESYTEWTPLATNQAGSYRLSRGSLIIARLQTRQEVLVWTDAALYSMQYIGPPFVWGTNILADNISIIGPNAAYVANNITYWMGTDNFYSYSGRVDVLPCTLLRHVFSDINQEQGFQVSAAHNRAFNEVWWFYCSANSTVVDRYVIFNYAENVWSYGEVARTAWFEGRLREHPIAVGYDNLLLYHEFGTDDGTQNPPLPVPAFITSAPVNIEDGQHWAFIRRMQPDVSFTGSKVNNPKVKFCVAARPAPGAPYWPRQDNEVVSGQDYSAGQRFTIETFTQEVYPRVRGQQVQFTIESEDIGVAWQWGVVRADIRPDGRK